MSIFKKNNSHQIWTKKDIFDARMISLLLVMNSLRYFISLIYENYLDVFVISLFFIFLLIINKNYINPSKNLDTFGILLFLGLGLSISGFSYQNNLINWLGIIYNLVFFSFPWYLVGRNTINYHCVISHLRKTAYVITFIVFCIYYHKKMTMDIIYGDMEIGYAILPAFIISLFFFARQKKLLDLLNIIICFYILIIAGSRGPLLCVLIFLILYLILILQTRIFTIIPLIIFSIFGYVNFNNILFNIIILLDKFDLQSRIINKLYEGSITSDSGRNAIFDVVYTIISKYPLTGVGIGVERLIINKEMQNSHGVNETVSISYPHNIFLEFWAQYGLILGSIFILIISLLIFIPIIKGEKIEKELLIIFIPLGFVHLWISSSYILSPYFFYLLGISVNIFLSSIKRKQLVMEKAE
jgi:O-antigen ligase